MLVVSVFMFQCKICNWRSFVAVHKEQRRGEQENISFVVPFAFCSTWIPRSYTFRNFVGDAILKRWSYIVHCGIILSQSCLFCITQLYPFLTTSENSNQLPFSFIFRSFLSYLSKRSDRRMSLVTQPSTNNFLHCWSGEWTAPLSFPDLHSPAASVSASRHYRI